MTLLVPAGVAAPPPPPPPRIEERINVTWIAPDGREVPLTVPAGSIRAQATSALSAAVPIQVTTDDNPRGGVDIRHTQELERPFLLPVLVIGTTHLDLNEKWRSTGDAITQTTELGPGILRVAQPDGSVRELDAVYLSGWEGIAEHGWDWDLAAALTLMAPRPWWKGPPVPVFRSEFSEAEDYYTGYRRISSGRVLGSTETTNPGQVKAWPFWTIKGPLDQLVATNVTTGEVFTLNPDWDSDGSLVVGETVTISSDPFQVRGPAGEIWTGAISGTLWGLRRGLNQITFAATGAAAGTAIELSYRPLYQVA